MQRLVEVPQRPHPYLARGIAHRNQVAQRISIVGQRQVGQRAHFRVPHLSSQIFRQLNGSVVRPTDGITSPHRGQHPHQCPTLLHSHHEFVAEEQQPAAIQVHDRTPVGPQRVDPLVLGGFPQ